MPDTKKIQTPSPNKKTTGSGTDCMKPLPLFQNHKMLHITTKR